MRACICFNASKNDIDETLKEQYPNQSYIPTKRNIRKLHGDVTGAEAPKCFNCKGHFEDSVNDHNTSVKAQPNADTCETIPLKLIS